MSNRTLCLVIIAILSIGATPAFAQGEFVKGNLSRLIKRLGVEVSAGLHQSLDKDVTKGTTVGAAIGLAPGHNSGWRYPVSLAFVSADLRGPTGGQFGTLKARAALAGIGYGWHRGKFLTSAVLQGGVSHNRTQLLENAAVTFNRADAVTVANSRNSLVVRPQVRLEYFVTEQVTVRTSLSYVYMQPNIEVRTADGRAPGSWNAHNTSLSMGFGYYPFRK